MLSAKGNIVQLAIKPFRAVGGSDLLETMKHLLGLLSIPAILLGQVFAFSTLSELQNEVDEVTKEVSELDAHQTYAAQQQRYHQNRADFFSLKVKEIQAAKAERKNFLSLKEIELHDRRMSGEGDKPEEMLDTGASKPFNIHHLARSVGQAETGGCKKGYGVTHNNCHGIKSGNTYPCKSPKGTMCRFDTKEESYHAFTVIRERWYGGMPTMATAGKRTGGDRTSTRLANVNHIYYNN